MTTHKITILKKLLSGAELSSSDMFASNSNQYFVDIKNHGVELKEVWTPNKQNPGRHLERSLVLNEDNISIAVKYLRKLQRKQS